LLYTSALGPVLHLLYTSALGPVLHLLYTSALGPVLHLLYTSDLPKLESCAVATFVHNAAILTAGSNNEKPTGKLQTAINQVKNGQKWNIQLNESKSVHINFTNRRFEYISVRINNQNVPYANTAKYLGMTLDAKLRWKAHVKKKTEELEMRYKKMYWLIGRNSSRPVITNFLYTNKS
jgi:hypothetical protein